MLIRGDAGLLLKSTPGSAGMWAGFNLFLGKGEKFMSKTKGILEPRKNYMFTLLMTRVSEGKWEGQVLRFPHPKQQVTAWGKTCGKLSQADTEDGLKRQLGEIVNEYDR